MVQNGTNWKWTKPRERAARLIAEDEQTDDEIALALRIGRTTLSRWKQAPEFQARVDAIRRELGDLSLRYAIGRRARRLAELERRRQELVAHRDSLQQVIAERAADESRQGVPGGGTGQLVRRVKQIGGGEHAERVEEWEFDAALARELREVAKELREHEKQAAVELGQWEEKQRLEGDVVVRRYIGVNPEDV